MTISEFIAKWRASGASERINYALFFAELCDVLDALSHLHRDDAGRYTL